jgi:PhoH-like ATPase
MKKNYIIDTSVLIHDPTSFKSFSGNDVIIPVNVLDELDKLKNLPNEAGKNARVCIRALDAICAQGIIHKGIKIENNITLKIDTTNNSADKFGPSSYVDNKILACAFAIKEKNKKLKNPQPTILVSKDINLRIRARAFDIKAEDYEKDRTAHTDLYVGFKDIVSEELGYLLQEHEEIDFKLYDEFEGLNQNECVHLIDNDGRGLAIGRRINDKIKLIPDRSPWGLNLRNKEQAFAADLLSDPKVPLVTLVGRAGTGKSLVAVAAALDVVLSKKTYNKLIIYRPIQPMGNDIGYLPGSMEEKLDPWMQPIKDSLEFLTGKGKKGTTWKDNLSPQYAEKIEMHAITYVRGRSIPNAFILIDEAQNLSKEEVKTLLTRASNGTKIVLTGDIEQIDNSFLDATNNGLSYAIEKFKESELSGHITFSKGERSALASKASEIL